MTEQNWLLRLCAAVDMPQEVTDTLLSFSLALPRFCVEETPENWESHLAALRETLGEDPDGIKLLAAMLLSAEDTWKQYEAHGIGWDIFTETMTCFPRFVREHMETFGRYGFDRWWWVPRQLSCRLFRIGVLEYELTEEAGQNIISLHIPGGADLSEGVLRESYLAARSLIGRCFPGWAEAPMVCWSWLLSPTLRELLPPASRILGFQSNFTITSRPQSGNGFLLWVYKRTDLPYEALPEETSLQRKLKAHLLAGGTFPDGRGVLSPDPFLPKDNVSEGV